MGTMDVLLIESHPGLGRQATLELEQAGHQVFHCTETRDRPSDGTDGTVEIVTPCVGLRDSGVCPLDAADLDAAVLVRVGTEMRSGEHGAICAARHRIPVVVSGDAMIDAGLPVVETSTIVDLPAAVERAAESGTAHASAVVRELLSLGVIARHEVDADNPSVAVQVERSARRLLLSIWLREDDSRAAEIARAAGQALRAHDRHVPVVDVVLRVFPARLDGAAPTN
jgi:hypothetical protein